MRGLGTYLVVTNIPLLIVLNIASPVSGACPHPGRFSYVAHELGGQHAEGGTTTNSTIAGPDTMAEAGERFLFVEAVAVGDPVAENEISGFVRGALTAVVLAVQGRIIRFQVRDILVVGIEKPYVLDRSEILIYKSDRILATALDVRNSDLSQHCSFLTAG